MIKKLPATLLLLSLVACGTMQPPPAEPEPLTLGLDATEQMIVDAALRNQEHAIALLEESARIPSATLNHEGIRKVGAVFASELEDLGFTTRWIEAPDVLNRAGHLVAERSGTSGKRILLLGHLDTVIDGDWFERDGDLARASGGEDMKGGLVIIIEALRALQEAGTLDDHQIIVFFTGDEEEGGRPLDLRQIPMVEAAQRSDIALSFEGTGHGTVTVGRRGTEQWIVEVKGKTGHSAGIFRRGYGASYEAARIVDGFRQALSGIENVALNPAVVISGSDTEYDAAEHRGSTSGVTNIIADHAVIEGDMRFLTPEQRLEVMETMESIVSTGNLPGTSASIQWNEGYPSMPPTPGNYSLARVLDGVSRDLGREPIEPGDPGRRGAGDVSFVAAHVDAAIDGLGATGRGAHTIDEFVRLDDLAPLAARAAVLIHRLTDPERIEQIGRLGE